MQPVPYRLCLNSTGRGQPAPAIGWRTGERHPDQPAQDSVILGSAGPVKQESNSSRPIGVCMLIPSLFTGQAPAPTGGARARDARIGRTRAAPSRSERSFNEGRERAAVAVWDGGTALFVCLRDQFSGRC